ncbi:Bug family tripartite tricarboxylate transporter substrate binding protein [Polynucleobacter nymphae]|uniref:Bug family tripartite tricarboxylate transporter substrate binding protein n=1 Tax=Polynucleobacter nymphae TaxID=2081043 RepID=UPI002103E750|nr:tripartite tricarboxylate transporter substrate binding protein [Polynucleobacter nymphae]
MKLSKILLPLMLAAVSTASMAADPWPNRPIKFVVGFGPGGANDLVARAVAEGVSKQLGQPVIVENKPGAGSVVGGDYVAKTTPDGYTFYAGAAGGIVTIPMLRSNMPYKQEDLVPVGMMAVSPSIIVVNADSPIQNFKDLLAKAQVKPGVTFATAGTGSTPHFVAEMLKLYAGGGIYEIIPYKSGSEGMFAVVSKQVDATSEASVVVLPQIEGGKLRPLASTWNKRITRLPNVPTTKELGYPNLFIGHWSGIFAPKGTPPEVIAKMNSAIQAALDTNALKARLIPQGIEPTPGTQADFMKFLTEERKRLLPVVKNANMKDE